MPSWCLTFMNWKSGLDFKLLALKYRRSNAFISITRDRDTGRVYADPASGHPRVQYTPSRFDRAHALTGILALAKILYITGAEEIHACITGVEPFIRNPSADTPAGATAESSSDTKADIFDEGVSNARFQAWLKHVESVGNAPPAGIFGTAHQMGTNRMSVRPDAGVVDPTGQVWGTRGLYVADASVFPSASGVNPMITNMAISDWTSRGVAAELTREMSRASL
jgi:choline dehydrogenase-like flavoprotein